MEVSFYLTRSEVGKQTSIYAHIRYSGYRFKYYLSEKIDPQFWSLQEQRAKKTNRFPGYMEFNRRMGKVYDKIKDIYSAYRNDHDNSEPSPEVLRVNIDNAFNEGAKKSHKTFISFFEEIKQASTNGTRVQYKTGKPFTTATIKAYGTAINHLRKYEEARRAKIDFNDITVDFHSDYTEFLIKKYKLGANSIGKDIKNIKMVMNEATERGINKNFQFKSKKFSVTKDDSFSIYLSEKELEALIKYDLSGNPRLERVRDLFIAGCYTGLRFSDLSALRSNQIQSGFIKVTQTKTGDPVVIPVHPELEKIMDRYEASLPAAISNQKTNDYLKEIGRNLPEKDENGFALATLNEIVSKTTTKGGLKVTTMYKKWELLSTHTARRSFATNEYIAGTPSITIMAITGHKTEKSFLKYIKLLPTEHAQKMKDLWATRNKLKAV